MLPSPRSNRRSSTFAEYNDLEKYSKYLFMKTAQIVIQSRLGERTIAKSDPLPKHQAWFCLSINVSQTFKAIKYELTVFPMHSRTILK